MFVVKLITPHHPRRVPARVAINVLQILCFQGKAPFAVLATGAANLFYVIVMHKLEMKPCTKQEAARAGSFNHILDYLLDISGVARMVDLRLQNVCVVDSHLRLVDPDSYELATDNLECSREYFLHSKERARIPRFAHVDPLCWTVWQMALLFWKPDDGDDPIESACLYLLERSDDLLFYAALEVEFQAKCTTLPTFNDLKQYAHQCVGSPKKCASKERLELLGDDETLVKFCQMVQQGVSEP